MLDYILNLLSSLNISDWILLFTFFAIVAYTIETYKLRKWQQKSVQISIFDLRQRILMHADEMRSKNIPPDRNINNRETINMMNDILEHGKFNLKKLYAKGIIRE